MSAPRSKAVLAALALLGACAGPRPGVPPDAKVEPPAAWRTAPEHAGPELSATWWDAFGDPGLTRIVAAALADNDDVRIAAARVEELLGQADFAHAQRLPEVNGEVVYQRDRSINPAFGIPQIENVTEPVVTFSFDTDLFGRLRAADAAARANLLGTRAAQADVRLLVAATAARDWFTLRSLDVRLATLRQTLDARAQTLKLVRRRVSVGYAAQLDLQQAEAEYEATRQQIPATELAIRRTEDALSILLGRNPGGIDREGASARAQAAAHTHGRTLRRFCDADRTSSMPRNASSRPITHWTRPAPRSCRTSNCPGTSAVCTSTILDNRPIDIFTIGASILAPIFDAGRLKAQEDSAAARRDQAAFGYRKAALEAFGQVEDALAATQRLHEQLDSLQAQKAALDKTLAIATERYKSGYSPFLDQLDAQRNLLSVQLAIAQAQADELNAYVTLFQALGGGWDRSLVDNAPAKRT